MKFYRGHAFVNLEREMQEINVTLLDEVNDQDKTLVERIQRGVNTTDYQPGPLALAESAVYSFHERIRELIPLPGLPGLQARIL